jgi:hypothetical protein
VKPAGGALDGGAAELDDPVDRALCRTGEPGGKLFGRK